MTRDETARLRAKSRHRLLESPDGLARRSPVGNRLGVALGGAVARFSGAVARLG